jgi:hypothetical protein
LLAPHVPHRVRIVARASPAGLGACSRMRTYFCANPKERFRLPARTHINVSARTRILPGMVSFFLTYVSIFPLLIRR